MNTKTIKKAIKNICVYSIVFMVLIALSSCLKESTNSITHMGKDEDGREIYNIQIGNVTHEGLFLLTSCESASGNTPMSVDVYGITHASYLENGPYIPIMAITLEKKLMLFEWERCDLYPPSVYLGDIDGYGQDEIVFHSTIFYRQHPVHVLKLVGNELVELYRFPQYTDDPSVSITEIRDSISAESLNFGFTNQLMDSYQMLLEFPKLKFSKMIDLSNYEHMELNWHYDENGKLLGTTLPEIRYSYFYPIDLVDVDGDGICEIIGTQNIDLYSKQTLGSVKITLKYDYQGKTMDVIAVDF